MEKAKLIGKKLSELQAIASEMNLPSYAAGQIADWIYKKRITAVRQMTNLSLQNRERLSARYEVGIVLPEEEKTSTDGTKKYLFNVNGNYIETVYIPEKERATLCVSTQVGCKMNCLFCLTGKQGFSGNLTAGDMLNQIQAVPESGMLTNIVFMGMGEPFDNMPELMSALEIMTSDYGYGWSPKRITVSSVGILPGLQHFLEKSSCNLAISLHSPVSEERLKLMPVEKVFPVAKIVEEIKKYDFSGQRRVSFEYILFKGINDTPSHARLVARLLEGVECRVNLIRFHSIEGIPLKGASDLETEKFREELLKRGIRTTIRKSRGEDILAACGLLSTQKQNYGNL